MANPVNNAPPKRPLRAIFRWTRNVFAGIGIVFLFYHLLFDLAVVVSPSMSPTLRGTSTGNGDWVLTERITYRLRSPRRWELVQFHDEEGVSVIKRAVGLPNETIGVRSGRPIINDALVQPPGKLAFLHYYEYGPYVHDGRQAPCGDGYFVMGDDSRDSLDSRFTGPLKPQQITGRPLLIVWPPGRFGWANP